MNRAEQDAADTLYGYEFQQAERARWARAQPQKIVSVWSPRMTDEQRKQHEIDVITFNLPF